jgi:hypothetical protein
VCAVVKSIVEVDSMAEKEPSVELTVNGKRVGMKPFVKSVFIRVVMALLETLKNVDDPDEVVLKITR